MSTATSELLCWRKMVCYIASIAQKKGNPKNNLCLWLPPPDILLRYVYPLFLFKPSCMYYYVVIFDRSFTVYLRWKISYSFLGSFSIAAFLIQIIILIYMLFHFDHLSLVQFSYLKSSNFIPIHINPKNILLRWANNEIFVQFSFRLLMRCWI